jgi:putative peptidoglycan lipid II flippase
VTGPAVPLTRDSPDPPAQRSAVAGIGRAAILIAVLTIGARLLGLVRTLVFAKTVGATCLGIAYTTANQVPNIIYDIALGGALTSIMVPVLARPELLLGGRDEVAANEVGQTSSALLTWSVLILLPVSVGIAAAAGPLATALNPHNSSNGCAGQQHALVGVTGSMLAVFAPQILLYGLAVVLYGVLQAHRRFAAPALAPVISSLVVITAYLVFWPFGHQDVTDLAALPDTGRLILSVGTTAGVAALVLTALIPAARLRLRLRPTLRFPEGIGRRARGLALYGIAALLAQDAAALVVVVLANGHGAKGAIVLYGYGWQVFETAYAVLAISIAVSAFPVLSVREGAEFDATAAGSARAVLLLSFAGTALLVAVAIPAARLLASYPAQVPQLAAGFALFSLGLAGYGLIACLSRVLLAAHRVRAAGVLVVGGWLLVIGADILLVSLVPGRWVVAMLALGNAIGLTASGLGLMAVVRRARGAAAVAGTLRTAVAGLAAAIAGAGAGAGVAAGLPSSGPVEAGLAAVLAAACALAVFTLVSYLLDGRGLRAALASARRSVLR